MKKEDEERAQAQAWELAYEARNARVARAIGAQVAAVRRAQRITPDGPPYTPEERKRQQAALRTLVQVLNRTPDEDRFCQQYDDGRALVRLERKNLELQARMRTDGTGTTAIAADLPGVAMYWARKSGSAPIAVNLETWTDKDGAPVPVQIRNAIQGHLEHMADAIRADEEE